MTSLAMLRDAWRASRREAVCLISVARLVVLMWVVWSVLEIV